MTLFLSLGTVIVSLTLITGIEGEVPSSKIGDEITEGNHVPVTITGIEGEVPSSKISDEITEGNHVPMTIAGIKGEGQSSKIGDEVTMGIEVPLTVTEFIADSQSSKSGDESVKDDYVPVTQENLKNDQSLRDGKKGIRHTLLGLRDRICVWSCCWGLGDIPDLKYKQLKNGEKVEYEFIWSKEQWNEDCDNKLRETTVEDVSCQASYTVKHSTDTAGTLHEAKCKKNPDRWREPLFPQITVSEEVLSSKNDAKTAENNYVPVTEDDLKNDKYLSNGKERIRSKLLNSVGRLCWMDCCSKLRDLPDLKYKKIKIGLDVDYKFKWTRERWYEDCYGTEEDSESESDTDVSCEASYTVKHSPNIEERLSGSKCTHGHDDDYF